MTTSRIHKLNVLIFTTLALASIAIAGGSLSIDWFALSNGGGASSGGGFTLEGTVGRHDAGEPLSGGGFALVGGFQPGAGGELPEPCEGDANGDGNIDPLDTGYVLSRFGCPVGTGNADCDAADANGDGQVDPLDAGFVLSRFGACP